MLYHSLHCCLGVSPGSIPGDLAISSHLIRLAAGTRFMFALPAAAIILAAGDLHNMTSHDSGFMCYNQCSSHCAHSGATKLRSEHLILPAVA